MFFLKNLKTHINFINMRNIFPKKLPQSQFPIPKIKLNSNAKPNLDGQTLAPV